LTKLQQQRQENFTIEQNKSKFCIAASATRGKPSTIEQQ